MRGTSVLSVLVLAAIACGQSPSKDRHRAEVEWLWSNTRCVGDMCYVDEPCYIRAQAEWLWTTTKITHPADLPPKEEVDPAKLYGQLRDRAVKEGKPLVVGVGCEPPRVEGCLACRYDTLTGYKNAIVVGKPQGKELLIAGVVHCQATSDEVLAVVKPKPAMPLTASR